MEFYMALSLIKSNPDMGIKLPEWGGFWMWRDGYVAHDENMLFICLNNGRVIEIRDTDDIAFTLDNINRKDWQEIDISNVEFEYILGDYPISWRRKKVKE